MEVFLTSPWVPAEWIRAHGLEPRGIWSSRDLVLESLPLAAGACSFANAVVRLADRQAGSAVVFTTHCDQLRRGFDSVTGSASSRIFLFNLPVTWQTPVAARIFTSELERLGQFLVGLGGHTPMSEELTQILADYNSSRIRLLEAAADCPARQYAETVAQFHWDGSVNLPPRAESRRLQSEVDLNSIPVALVGGPLPRSQWHVLDAIESAGGRVVLNATEAGERSLWSASERRFPTGLAGNEYPTEAAGLPRPALVPSQPSGHSPALTSITVWMSSNAPTRASTSG